MCANQTFMGLVVSFVLKYSNNIMKLFISATAMFFTTALTALIFSVTITRVFLLSLLLVTGSLYVYNVELSWCPGSPETRERGISAGTSGKYAPVTTDDFEDDGSDLENGI